MNWGKHLIFPEEFLSYAWVVIMGLVAGDGEMRQNGTLLRSAIRTM